MAFSRPPIPMLPIDRRTGMTEVEVGYDEQSAMEEARRCLRCWINTMFEGYAGRREPSACSAAVAWMFVPRTV